MQEKVYVDTSSLIILSKIIDDLKARKVAETLNLKFTGCIGILIIAKEKGFIISVRFYLEKIQQTNFRISMQLIKNALVLAKEK
jgi:predicted nucleic acid-binding protein